MQSLQIDMIRIELGYELISLLSGLEDMRLPNQVKKLRNQIAKDMGFILPSVRIQDNMSLGNDEYVIKIKDVEVGKNVVRAGKLLIMNQKGTAMTIDGEDVNICAGDEIAILLIFVHDEVQLRSNRSTDAYVFVQVD